jgi:hypothetical protein
VRISLPARLNDDLDWSKEKALAEEAIAKGRLILWELDLGLDQVQFHPGDTAIFYSFSLAVEEFTKTLWSHFQTHTLGVILYRGSFRPSHSFPGSLWEPSCMQWLEELGIGGKDPLPEENYSLYCAQVLAEYLHRLISFLPDVVLPFALIDVSGIASSAHIAQLFSKERFEHLNLALKGAPFPFAGICWEEGDFGMGWIGTAVRPAPTVGIYLPGDRHFGAPLTLELDALMAHLHDKQIPFRILPEEKLMEQWDGLDELIVPACPLSPQGQRKLQGFIAAGGTVTSEGVK